MQVQCMQQRWRYLNVNLGIDFEVRSTKEKHHCSTVNRKPHTELKPPCIMIHLPLEHPYFHVFSSFSFSSQSPQVLHPRYHQLSVYGAAVSLRQWVQRFQQAQRKLLHAQPVSFLSLQLAEWKVSRNAIKTPIVTHYLLFSSLDLSGLSIRSFEEIFSRFQL